MNATVEGIWLFGSVLAGVLVVYGNANSWSLAGQSQSWYGLAGHGVLIGGILYLASLVARFAFRRRGQ